MIAITSEHIIYLACEAVDFRKSIDGYAAPFQPRSATVVINQTTARVSHE